MNMLRPISRKYDRPSTSTPRSSTCSPRMIDGVSESGASQRRRREPAYDATTLRRRRHRQGHERRQPRLGALHRGDVLGRRRPAAVDAAPGPRQLRDRVGRQRRAARALRAAPGRRWRSPSPAPARTPPTSRPPRCKDGDEYVINGEKIYVTSGERADSVVVWATLDKEPRPRGDQVVRGPQGQPRHARWSGSSTSSASAPPTPRSIIFEDCRVPAEDLLGSPEIDTKQGFAGAMATFDNTRPLVAAMAVGLRPRVARPDPRPARAGGRGGRLRPPGASASRRPRRRSSSSRPTGRRRTC